MMYKILTLFLLIALAALAACAPAGGDSTAEPAAPGAPTTQPARPESTPSNAEAIPTTAPLEAEPPIPTDLPPAVQQAVSDLVGRLDVRSSAIEVVRAEPVIWSDGSLGCPQPGMMYTQALVDGMFIQLSVDGTIYNYHSGGSQDPFLCELEMNIAPGELPPGATSNAGS